MGALDELAAAAADLALGGACAGCSAPGRSLCDLCSALLLAPARLSWPNPVPVALPPPYAIAVYEGPVRALLLAYKEHARYGLARPLGEALASVVLAVLEATWPQTWPLDQDRLIGLVPPPSAGGVTRTRGHDPVLRMARRAAVALRRKGLRCAVQPVLGRERSLVDQAGLGADERMRNLAGGFRVRGRAAKTVRRRPLVFVDDVLTTGATAAEATRALSVEGGVVLGVAVVAATQRRMLPARAASSV